FLRVPAGESSSGVRMGKDKVASKHDCNPQHRDHPAKTARCCLLFVYGTLMRGQPAHRLMRRARLLISHATTPVGFTLYDLGPYPAAVRQGSGRVYGELYAVPSVLLRRLDTYERCPQEYQRSKILTPRGAAWIYLYPTPPRRGHRLKHGHWRRRRS
ncbi:MAG: gamma-glutamylcyclotransferase, partial [Flavobacteriales bacterium]